MKKIFRLLTIFALLPFAVNAQTGKLFDTDKQLSSSLINTICQDRNGRIWIGTHNGLNIYDGYQFHIYKKNDKNGNGLASNVINCMIRDRDGKMYIGTYNALQVYENDHFKTIDTRDAKNHKILCYVNCIYQTRNGDILIGTSGRGILKLHGGSNIAKEIRFSNSAADYTKEIVEDKYGRIWIITQDKGMGYLDFKKKMVHAVKGSDNTSLTDMCQDSHGNIFVSTINSGLFQLNHRSYSLEHVSISGNLSIACLYVNKNGKILLGSNGKGLYVYDPVKGKINADEFYSNEVDLSHGKIYSVIEDKSGNIWMGLLQKGVFMQPVHKSGIEFIGNKAVANNPIGDACVMCTKYLKDGSLCVSTDNNGLYILDSNRKLKRHFIPGISGMPSTILGIAEGQDGKLWISSFVDGCGWIDRNNGQYHRLPCTYGNASSVFDLAVDKNGNLWIGTMGDGLKKMNFKTNTITEYKNVANNVNSNRLYNNYIAQLLISDDGNRLYVGTAGAGIYCLDMKTNNWKKVFGRSVMLEDQSIIAMKEDKRGNVWAGSSEGLYCINLNSRRIRKYTTSNGLADNAISSIETDINGRIWVSTSHGISCVTPSNGNINNYYAGYGMQCNEFSEGASSVSYSGNIVFGGMGGIAIFNPKDIFIRRNKLPIYIANFSIGGESVTADMKSGNYVITDQAAIDTHTFELSHVDNTFTVYLSTMTYSDPEQITYLYSLNGDKWIKLQQGKNELTFSHLPSGTYHFRVKALDNKSESDVREFVVEIHPAWYFSIWAKLFYSAIVILFVIWYLRSRRRKEQDRLRLQEHIHAEELSESKLRFFMNISHEIRTPMTLIVAPLLSLMKEDNDVHRHSAYVTIKRNAERILHLINQMMDMRKIDKGQMAMRMMETNIVTFADEIYTLFSQQAKTKNINFKFEHDSDDIPVWIDRGNFDKVLMNILSNAFKFTSTGGEVTISITHNKDNVSIAVSDDGEKIPEDKLGKIFERFYQASSMTNDRQTGTGIGLDLTRSLVELHHGTISARNKEKGCVFIVTIPLGSAHLRPEEMIKDDEPMEENPLYGIENFDDSEEEDIVENIPQMAVSNKKRPVIVIVEDDEDIRKYLNEQLSGDYTIIECSDGKEALPIILKVVPSLVISDIMMPEMDGNTLCAKIKTNVNTNHIPVILLTAKNRDEDKLEGLETGADAYIVKPFNMDILRRTIINQLNARNMLRNKFTGKESQEEHIDEIQVKSPDEKLLERVMTVINQNIVNTELSVDMIAEEVGISRVHLHRKMKELTNQTPHDLIRNIRLKKAANLLSTQHQNITEVMYACGFGNAASFSTMFRNMYGMTPRDYMKEHLQRNGDA